MTDADIVLRPARVTDLPAIVEGEQRYMRELEPEHLDSWHGAVASNLALWIDNLDHARVLEDAGGVCGYVVWMVADAEATVITVHVTPDHRRQGLAGRLMDAVVASARADGLTGVRLGVLAGNPARLLYEGLGYEPTGADGDYLLYRLALVPPPVR